MNGDDAMGRARLAGDHVLAVRAALARYASAREIEDALERDRDIVFRKLAAARDETFAAWRKLNAALEDEAESEGEGEP